MPCDFPQSRKRFLSCDDSSPVAASRGCPLVLDGVQPSYHRPSALPCLVVAKDGETGFDELAETGALSWEIFVTDPSTRLLRRRLAHSEWHLRLGDMAELIRYFFHFRPWLPFSGAGRKPLDFAPANPGSTPNVYIHFTMYGRTGHPPPGPPKGHLTIFIRFLV